MFLFGDGSLRGAETGSPSSHISPVEMVLFSRSCRGDLLLPRGLSCIVLRLGGFVGRGACWSFVCCGFLGAAPPGDQDSPESMVFFCCWARGLGPPGDQRSLLSDGKFCSRRGFCTGSESQVSPPPSVLGAAFLASHGGCAQTSGFFCGMFHISWNVGLSARFGASNFRFSFQGAGFEGPVAGTTAGSD